MGNAGPPGAFAQGEAADALLLQQESAGRRQGFAELAVMVGLSLGTSHFASDKIIRSES